MSEQQTITPGDVATLPTDKPARGRRYRVFPDGDYMVLQVASQDSGLPVGSLVPIPEVPQFESVSKAFTWIRGNGGQLTGMQLMVLRAHRICTVQTAPKVSVEIIEKPRELVNDPPEQE